MNRQLAATAAANDLYSASRAAAAGERDGKLSRTSRCAQTDFVLHLRRLTAQPGSRHWSRPTCKKRKQIRSPEARNDGGNATGEGRTDRAAASAALARDGTARGVSPCQASRCMDMPIFGQFWTEFDQIWAGLNSGGVDQVRAAVGVGLASIGVRLASAELGSELRRVQPNTSWSPPESGWFLFGPCGTGLTEAELASGKSSTRGWTGSSELGPMLTNFSGFGQAQTASAKCWLRWPGC